MSLKRLAQEVMSITKSRVQNYTGQFVEGFFSFFQMTPSSLLLRSEALTTYWYVSQRLVAASLVVLYILRTKKGVRVL